MTGAGPFRENPRTIVPEPVGRPRLEPAAGPNPMSEASQRDRLDASGVAGAVVCCLLWAGNAVAVKAAIPAIPPLGCAAIRFLLGLPVTWLLCRWAGQDLRIGRGRFGLLILHGLITTAQIGTFNWGASHGEAGRSTVFINVHPLVVAPVAWWLLGERMGVKGLAGILSAAVGVVILLAEPLRRGGGLAGDLVVLTSGVIFGLQTIVQKLTFSRIAPAALLVSQTALAAVFAGISSAVVEGPGAFRPTPEAWMGVLYQGLAVSGFGFALWMALLRRYPAGRLTTLAFLTPLFGVALGHLTRGEAVTPSLVAGSALVGLGVALTSSDRATGNRKGIVEAPLGLPGDDAP